MAKTKKAAQPTTKAAKPAVAEPTPVKAETTTKPATVYTATATTPKAGTFAALVHAAASKGATLAQIVAGIQAAQADPKVTKKPVPTSAKDPNKVIAIRAKHFVTKVCAAS